MIYFSFLCRNFDQQEYFSPGGGGGGGYSIYPWVGKCGPALLSGPHTLTLFKTKIADFLTLFKTEFRFLIPCSLRLPGSPKSELQERWPKKFRKKLCYFRLLPNLAHRKLIDLANHLPSSSHWLLTVTHRVFESFEFYCESRGIFVSRFCE